MNEDTNKSWLPDKFLITKNFFTNRDCKELRIIDVGGTIYCRDILQLIFPKSDLTLVNHVPDDLHDHDKSIVGDGSILPIKTESIEVVTAFDIIEHMTNPDGLIIEAFRVLKPNGCFVITTSNLADIYSRISFLFGYTPFSYTPSNKYRVGTPFSWKKETSLGHKNCFSFRSLEELLLIYGFDIIKKKGFCYSEPFYWDRNQKCYQRQLKHDKMRIFINKFIPNSMREGMIFISKKL